MEYVSDYGGSLITHRFFVGTKLGKKIVISKFISRYSIEYLQLTPVANSTGGEKKYENNDFTSYIG